MSSAASILRNSTRPSPACARDLAKSSAACASPSAEITVAFFCCSAFSTRKRAFSASCCATCFISTACVNSFPKVRCVMEISSRMTPNCEARCTRSSLTFCETISRCVINSPASNCATTAFKTSVVMDGSTLSS
uniref:Uncharacterized protein n=1 Tax=Lutzomyia longipalpis TaxID=7200 RepID=A0A7G3B4H4_LUTLO